MKSCLREHSSSNVGSIVGSMQGDTISFTKLFHKWYRALSRRTMYKKKGKNFPPYHAISTRPDLKLIHFPFASYLSLIAFFLLFNYLTLPTQLKFSFYEVQNTNISARNSICCRFSFWLSCYTSFFVRCD